MRVFCLIWQHFTSTIACTCTSQGSGSSKPSLFSVVCHRAKVKMRWLEMIYRSTHLMDQGVMMSARSTVAFHNWRIQPDVQWHVFQMAYSNFWANQQLFRFPSPLTSSIVTPLLKKPSLTNEDLINYRPISNLSIISKIAEQVVKTRLLNYLSSNSLLNPYQSAYLKHHST